MCTQCGHPFNPHRLLGYGDPPTAGWMECPVEGCPCRMTWSTATEGTQSTAKDGCVPLDKDDLGRANAAVNAGYPAVEPIMTPLMEWLQDCNWPVARILLPFFQSIGAPLAPHIWHVLRSDDDIWKYWVIGQLLPSLPRDAALPFRPELLRLSLHPTTSERREQLNEVASGVLDHFAWTGIED